MVKNRLHPSRGGTSDELQNEPKRSIRLPVLPFWRSQQQAPPLLAQGRRFQSDPSVIARGTIESTCIRVHDKHARFVPVTNRGFRQRSKMYTNVIASNRGSATGAKRETVPQDNIRQLVEQAAASSGAQDEERISGRIAQQQDELDKLVKERDGLLKK
jgi:hypothetical protein